MDKKGLKEQQLYQNSQQQQDYEQLPPYTSSSKRITNQPLPPTSKYPPQPHHTQSPSRSFRIAPRNWMTHSLLVLDSNNNNDAVLYTAKTIFMSSNITIQKRASPTQETTLAEVQFHSFRRRIDLRMLQNGGGYTITLPLQSMFNTESSFALPALQNARVTWRYESHFKSSELKCWDERSGVCLAKITTSWWSLRHESRFDLFGETLARNSQAVDEIVATGVSLLQHILRKRRNNAAAGGVAGGAGA